MTGAGTGGLFAIISHRKRNVTFHRESCRVVGFRRLSTRADSDLVQVEEGGLAGFLKPGLEYRPVQHSCLGEAERGLVKVLAASLTGGQGSGIFRAG